MSFGIRRDCHSSAAAGPRDCMVCSGSTAPFSDHRVWDCSAARLHKADLPTLIGSSRMCQKKSSYLSEAMKCHVLENVLD